jgi:DNA-binding response OmpR family regulator
LAISDAAAAMLIASEDAVKRHGLKPRARIHHISVLADDPIYMLTARAKKSDVEVAMKAGANGYIHKPFRGAELLDLVGQLKARPA